MRRSGGDAVQFGAIMAKAKKGINQMAMGRREKDIKLLVAKFIKLVESLDPGERLSIRKVAAKSGAPSKSGTQSKRGPASKNRPRQAAAKAPKKRASRPARNG
jgi:hypothetical protein